MNLRLRAWAILGISVITFLLGSCCDRKTRRIQSHWLRVFENMELTSSSLQRRRAASSAVEPLKISVGTTTKGDPFEGDAISGFVVAQHYGFWLDLMNKGDKPIRLLWPDARYVDEVGKQHTVYHYGQEQPPEDVLTPGPATTVPGGATLKQMIVPGYKTYMVGDCHEQHVFQEPLVPTRLDDKNEQQVKAYVDDLAKWQVPVKLVLPIEVDGVRYDYAFTFVLKDRWADLPKE